MRLLSPLLLVAMLAALHAAHSARSAPGTASTASELRLELANSTAAGAKARRLLYDFAQNDWCPSERTYRSRMRSLSEENYEGSCNLLGFTPDDIPEEATTPIAMIGGLGGGPDHVSYCNMTGPESKYAAKIQIYSDQETHRNLNYIDQITVTWSDGSSTRIGGCDRPGSACMDCEVAMVRDSDKHAIDLSGGNVVKSYMMAIDGFNVQNPGQAGRLFGSLAAAVTSASTGRTEQQGYTSVSAGYKYNFTADRSIGSGIVCGITYRSGSKVDAFGLVFYKSLVPFL